MPEEIDAGKIVAQIVLDTKSLQDNVDTAKDKLNELSRTNSTVTVKTNADYKALDYVRSSLEALGVTGQKASDVINSGFINKQIVQNYASSLEDMAAKIDNCRVKLRELSASSNIDSSAISGYKESLSSLEAQYDKVLQKLDEYIAKKIKEANAYTEGQQEIDAGKIVAQIVLDTKSLQDNVDTAKDKLNELSRTNSTVTVKTNADYKALDYVRSSLEALGVTGQKASDIINSGFINKQIVQNYASSLEDMAAKIDNCRVKLRELSASSNIDSSAISGYKETLSSLESQYDKVLQKLDEYIAKKIKEANAYTEGQQEIEALSGMRLPEISPESSLKAQSYADTITYIRDVLENLQITGSEADKIIKDCFSDVSSLRGYQNQIEIIAQKLERQKQIVSQLEAKKSSAQAAHNTSLEDKVTAQIEREGIKLKELEARYESVSAKQDAYVAKVVSNYQKQVAATEQATQKQEKLNQKLNEQQSRKDFSSSMFLVTSSLRTFNKVAPDAVNGMTSVIMQVNAIRRAMLSGASPALVWANVIVSAVGIVASFVVNEIEKTQQAQEEARQKAVQAAQEYKDSADEIGSLDDEFISLKTKLDSVNMSHSEEIDVKNQLMGIQKQLIDKYGDEAKSIDFVTGSIDKQREAVEKLSLEQAKWYVVKNYSAYQTAQEELSKKQSYNILTSRTKYSSLSDEEEKIKKFFESQNVTWNEKKETDTTNFKTKIWYEARIDIDTEDAEDKLRELGDRFRKFAANNNISDDVTNKIQKAIESAANSIDSEKITGYKDTIEQYESAQRIIDGIKTDAEIVQEQTEKINEIMQNSSTIIDGYNSALSELSSAYKAVANGEKLDSDTLDSLIEKYPAVAQYIKETGDLTLRNGEIISASMRNQNIQITKQLQAEKEALELQKQNLGYTGTAENIEQHEAIADRIEEINAQLRVSKANLKDILDEVKNRPYTEALKNIEALSTAIDEYKSKSSELQSTMSELADMERRLANGQQLDFEAILSLIDKYPELAAEIAAATGNANLQRQAIERLFEVKKQDYILTQKAAVEKIKASNEETMVIISNIQKQIVAYATVGDAVNTMLGMTQLAGLLSQVSDAEKEIAALEAKMNAVSAIDINSYKISSSSSSSSSSSAEKAKSVYEIELERIENLKSLGKLSTQQELAQLEQLRKRYRLNAEEAMDLEIRLYNLKKELKQEEIDDLSTLADAVTEALKNKYVKQQKIEEERIEESIENWRKWEEETTASIQAEIDALDKLSESQESENRRQEYEQKRQATELQLAYEKDDYNRKQLEKELNRLDKEEAQRLLEEQIKVRKEELQTQMESVQKTSSAAQEKLEAEKEALAENYEELTKEFNIRAAAEKVIMQSSQKEMVSLIKSYAPDYNMAGQTLGEQLYQGMKSKVDNIFAYIAEIENCVNSYQRQMAYTANVAVDNYWQSRNAYEKEIAAMSVQQSAAAKNITVQQTVNFNQPAESPVEISRQLDRTSQALAQQISGGL